jgi:hypothetical protein
MEPEHDDEPLVEVVVSKAVKGNGHELVKTLRNSRFQLVRRHWRDGSHPLTQRVALTVRAGPAHIHGGCAWSMEPATTASGRTLAWKQCTGAEELIMATPQGWHHHIALTRIRVHNCAVVVGEVFYAGSTRTCADLTTGRHHARVGMYTNCNGVILGFRSYPYTARYTRLTTQSRPLGCLSAVRAALVGCRARWWAS